MVYPYVGSVPWPIAQDQADWVDQLVSMEQWLDNNVGLNNWDWVNNVPQLATVAFRLDRDRTLFLLRWTLDVHSKTQSSL
jgi:hypothetical protein